MATDPLQRIFDTTDKNHDGGLDEVKAPLQPIAMWMLQMIER